MATLLIVAGLALALALLVGIHRRLRHRARPRTALLILFLLTCALGSNAPPKPGAGTIGGDQQPSQRPVTLLCPADNPATSPLPADLPPSETAAAGTIPGSFSVSRLGEATYSIPLLVPPGRAGMEPSLAITYSSSGGEGLLGVGFGLAGLSAITRCPSNLAQDGFIRAVRYDDADRLCLDGSRLVLVGSAFDFDGSGTREYRTIPDTFAKVVAHFGPGHHLERGPDWFEVFTKSGRIVEYGSTAGARAMAKNQVVAAWWVSREHDRRDNAIDYAYDNQHDPGDGHTIEIVPSRISYAHRADQVPTHSVLLVTKPAETPVTFFSGGMRLRRTKLLSRVEMRLEPSSTVVRSYQLDYAPGEGTKRPLLRAVRECAGASGPCKPETRFGWSSHEGKGLVRAATQKLIADRSYGGREKNREAWLLADVNGDGLDDFVVTHPRVSDSTIDEWWVGLNVGGSFAEPELWASFPAPGDRGAWSATPIDYDQDGLTDLFLDIPFESWPTYRWLHANPDHTFDLRDTGIPRAWVDVDDYHLANFRFMRLGDVNGDGVADLVQCVNHGYADEELTATRHWTVNFWSPSLPGGPGFDPVPRTIPFVDGVVDCGHGKRSIYVVDTSGDGAADLVVPFYGGTWGAIRHIAGDQWKSEPLHLWRDPNKVFTNLHFLDGNGDGLSDAIMMGVNHVHSGEGVHAYGSPPIAGADLPFRFRNTGAGFGDMESTLAGTLFADDWTDALGDAAVPIDFNGDGRMDLLLPVSGRCGDATDDPCWVVLQSSLDGEGLMTPIDTGIAAVTDEPGIAIRESFGARVTDIDGDGRHDLVLRNPADWANFSIFKNDGPQDLLISITDGMTPLDPGETGFVPTVEIQYGNLVDGSITKGLSPSKLAYDDQTYLAHADPKNGCAYPRACVVGSTRVVSGYSLSNGNNQQRAFSVKYRDGRYHHRGRGFLGFGQRIVLDADTGAGVSEHYDNIRHDPDRDTFPYAGQVVRAWAWSTEKPNRLDPGRVSVTFTQRALIQEDTNAGNTYFTMPAIVRTTREEGVMTPGPGKTVLRFVAAAEQTPIGVLGETWDGVSQHDDFGNALAEVHEVDGADLTTTVTRTYDNDPSTWLVGQLRHEKVCSAALGKTQCRSTNIEYNPRGEITHVAAGDPTDPGTQLVFDLGRDKFGHVTHTTARDDFGHVRAACVSYDANGIFPFAVSNALGHTTYTKRDPGLGVLTSAVDANGLVTRWRHDGLGRITEEQRPDGTTSSLTIIRIKSGGPQAKWWSVKLKTTESDGPTSTEELDSLGRAVHASTVAADVKTCGASVCKPQLQLEQETTYDFLGRVARVTLPWMSGDTLTGKLHHDYVYDASGRLTMHFEPWGRVTTFKHTGLVTQATDWLGTTTTQHDALGRPVKVIDKKGFATQTYYGPFSLPWATMRYAGQTTVTERDAYGRVIRELDPDRGTTEVSYDGFGDTLTVDDAGGRHYEFAYDALGRLVERTDPDGETTWEYDTAAHGIGRLAAVTNPAGVKRYGYDGKSRPISVELKLGMQTFAASFGYDTKGRLDQITYPQAPGVAPLVVVRDHDAFGNVIAVRDGNAAPGAKPFWKLTSLDGAGRPAEESFGSGVTARRDFDPASGLVERIQATRGGTMLQDLEYAYDTGLRMKTRADRLQAGVKGARTELFTHDVLDRLTCSRFADVPIGQPMKFRAGPCALTIDYDPTGNITHKSDVGAYVYDPAHPHAVRKAGTSVYGYDAVGNQTSRPGETIEYTAFDLPRLVETTGGESVAEFLYDGDQQRIRKSTGELETIYFEGLYERVSDGSGGKTLHRYYVAAGSATLVITRQAGQVSDSVAYLHTEALGSTDVVTDGAGAVLERRSHDAFGARRNPKWGQPWAGKAAMKGAPLGFTGHEEDAELGLVNMRGRIYDPKLGRFLQTDPIVAAPHWGQSWNRYSYVRNSPLNFVDPSGFVDEDSKVKPIVLPRMTIIGQAPSKEEQLSNVVTRLGAGSAAPVAGPSGPSPDGWTPPPKGWTSTQTKDAAQDDALAASSGSRPAGDASRFGQGSMGSMERGGDAPAHAGSSRLGDEPSERGMLSRAAERAAVEVMAWGCLASMCRHIGPGNAFSRHVEHRRHELEKEIGGPLLILNLKGPPAVEPMANGYSVAFEMKLKPSSYPGVSRGRHFQEANENLLNAMESDSVLAGLLRKVGVSIQRTATGVAPRKPPNGFAWHHAEAPGTMQLVPKAQHSDPTSRFWPALHPDGRGGWYLWGE